MTEVDRTPKVSRLASTRMRILLAVVALLVVVSAEIVIVLHAISSITARNVEDGVGTAKAAFLICTITLLLCVVAMALWSQIEIKKRLAAISHAANSIADGDLNPDIDLLIHDFDEVGRSAGAVQRMLVELRAIAAHAGRVAGGDLSGKMEPRSERDELRRSLSAHDRRPALDGLRPLASPPRPSPTSRAAS